VFDASFTATLPNYKCSVHRLTKDDTPAKLVPIYYMDTDAGMGFGQPDIYVDVSSLMDRKLKMLACHESQLVWLKDHDGIDVLETTRIYSQMRGGQCGVKYAEGYRRLMASLRATTKRLLP
jgi:LmbE family N-acetylglucosaminyl deacetylase